MLQMNLLRKHSPRWVIFSIDILICLTAISLAYLLRFNFVIPDKEYHTFSTIIPLVLIVRALSFLIAKTYAGIVRFTSTKDAERIFLVIAGGSVIFMTINFANYYFVNGHFIIPFSVIIIDFLVTVFIMTSSRLLVKILYLEYNFPRKEKTNVIIYGAGHFGLITKRTLDRDDSTNHKIVAFIDTTTRNIGKKLEGVSIYKADHLEVLFRKHNISKLIIAKTHVGHTRKREIIELCMSRDVKVLTIPPTGKWINGELSFNQIRDIKIEDLLGRAPINLDNRELKQQLLNKTIFVTGAAGSIGSEIVRQISQLNPKKIVLFDQAESPLYDIELELHEKFNFHNFAVAIGDITNYQRVENIIKEHQPSVIFHAAAYKHVPMMEENPYEAIRTNVQGTKNIADLAIKYEVSKFVMVSTDKAVNPTNVMGASKRIAEIYTQSINKTTKTSFITTRFGNVLGSNGSVIPRFRKQIAEGGPITITHPEITRYFMTIPEACQLVLEASAMGKGGEIYIFDMGQSVKILDLAKKMVKLSGLILGKDIQIQYTGLRPGEKLYEELLNDKENTLPTYHDQIMVADVRKYDFQKVSVKINHLLGVLRSEGNYKIVKTMKKIVPEFLSKNSIYEELDTIEEKEVVTSNE